MLMTHVRLKIAWHTPGSLCNSGQNVDNHGVGKPVIHVVAAVIEDDGRYLIVQRQPSAVLPLLWEFPGGRVEMDECPDQALIREISWRIGVDIEIRDELAEHLHSYEHYEVRLTLFAGRLPTLAMPTAVNVNDVRWVPSTKLCEYEFPPADQSTMDKLLGFGGNS